MSTPIETNTEELQEVLDSLYGLNMAAVGGGSSEPDLVIGLNVENTKVYPDGSSAPNRHLGMMTLDDVTILSGSVSATVEKIKQGLAVRVLLKDVHFYWSNFWLRSVAEASHVVLESSDAYYPDEGYLSLTVAFFVSNGGGFMTSPAYMFIRFDAVTGEVLYYSYNAISVK